jgi:hypothetical protein
MDGIDASAESSAGKRFLALTQEAGIGAARQQKARVHGTLGGQHPQYMKVLWPTLDLDRNYEALSPTRGPFGPTHYLPEAPESANERCSRQGDRNPFNVPVTDIHNHRGQDGADQRRDCLPGAGELIQLRDP